MNTDTLMVLQRAYFQPFSIQSNYARTKAREIAELSSRGLLTTKVGSDAYARSWRVSPSGLGLLEFAQGEDK